MKNIRDSIGLTQILIEDDMQFVSTVCSHLSAPISGAFYLRADADRPSDERVVESHLGKPHITDDDSAPDASAPDGDGQGTSEVNEHP